MSDPNQNPSTLQEEDTVNILIPNLVLPEDQNVDGWVDPDAEGTVDGHNFVMLSRDSVTCDMRMTMRCSALVVSTCQHPGFLAMLSAAEVQWGDAKID